MAPVKWSRAALLSPPLPPGQRTQGGSPWVPPAPYSVGPPRGPPELVYLMALCVALGWGWGTPAWRHAQAPLPVPWVRSCRDLGSLGTLQGSQHTSVAQGTCPRFPGESVAERRSKLRPSQRLENTGPP